MKQIVIIELFKQFAHKLVWYTRVFFPSSPKVAFQNILQKQNKLKTLRKGREKNSNFICLIVQCNNKVARLWYGAKSWLTVLAKVINSLHHILISADYWKETIWMWNTLWSTSFQTLVITVGKKMLCFYFIRFWKLFRIKSNFHI